MVDHAYRPLLRARLLSIALVVGASVLAAIAAPASSAAPAPGSVTYEVTQRPVTYTVSFDQRVQIGTAGGELLSAAYWSGTYKVSWAKSDCPKRTADSGPAVWTHPVYDLSAYKFNPTSPRGIQRRGCNQHNYGPAAPNPGCLPADCPVKVEFENGTYHPAVYAPTYPIYSWSKVSEAGLSFTNAQSRLGWCQALEERGETAACAAFAVRGTPGRAYTSKDCPESTPDTEYTCVEVAVPAGAESGGGTPVMTTHGTISVTLTPLKNRVLRVHVDGAPRRSHVILQRKEGARQWRSYPVAMIGKSHKLNRRWKVSPGRWRVVVKPRKTSGVAKVVSPSVRARR